MTTGYHSGCQIICLPATFYNKYIYMIYIYIFMMINVKIYDILSYMYVNVCETYLCTYV